MTEQQAAFIDLASRIFEGRKGLSYQLMAEDRRSEFDAIIGVTIMQVGAYPFEFGHLYTFLENGETTYRLEWNYHTPHDPQLPTTFLSLTDNNVFEFQQNAAFVDSFEQFAPFWNKWASRGVQDLKVAWYNMGFSMDTD